jgi:branched-chain amino acid transport system substrate-binding protein
MVGRRHPAAALILAVAVAACSGSTPGAAPSADTGTSSEAPASQATGAPIRIGASLALTGEASPDSKLVKDGYEFWATKVNQAGGIDVGGTKRPVELVIKDDGSDREQAARLVENLITEENVDLMLSPWGSGNTNAVAPIAERYERLMVAPLAASDSIWEQGYKQLFGILPIGSANLRPMVRLADTLGLESVSVVTTDDLFPLLAAEGAKDEATQAGIQVALDQTYPPGSLDIGSLITQITEADAPALLAPVDVADAIVLVNQLRERNYVPKALALSGATLVPDFLSNVGENAEGLFGITYWSPELPFSDPMFGTAADYAKDFEAQFGYAPTHDSVAASMAGYVLQLAVEAAGTTDNAAVRQELLDLQTQTVFGNIDFDDRGVNTGISTYVVQIQDGKPVVVFPDDAKATDPNFPVTSWGG